MLVTTVTVKKNVYSEFCSHFLDTCPLELCFGELLAMACPNFLSHQTPETSFTTSQTNTIGEGNMISYYRNLQVLEGAQAVVKILSYSIRKMIVTRVIMLTVLKLALNVMFTFLGGKIVFE